MNVDRWWYCPANRQAVIFSERKRGSMINLTEAQAERNNFAILRFTIESETDPSLNIALSCIVIGSTTLSRYLDDTVGMHFFKTCDRFGFALFG